jgi:short-subunit dehydrogenase involved in D-alanine esterification of teichoic acids
MLMSCRVTQTYPDIDCVFLNAGLQRVYDFSKPESVDLQAFFSEFNTNFTSMVTLTHAFLPFLQSKKAETSLIL